MSVKYVASSPFVVVCWCYVSHSVAFTANYICHFEFAFIHTHTHTFFLRCRLLLLFLVFIRWFGRLLFVGFAYCLCRFHSVCVCVYICCVDFFSATPLFVREMDSSSMRPPKKKLIRLLHCQLIFRLVRPHCSSTMDILFRSFVQSVQFLINMQSIM